MGSREARDSLFSKSATPPDVLLHVHGRPFCLNRKLLAARSVKLASLFNQDNPKEHPSYSLTDVPGDIATFELVIRFCYGFDLSLSASNVVPLICVACYLDMTENYSPNNLINKALTFFHLNVLPQWSQCVEAFSTAELVFEQAWHLHLLDACVNSLVGMARLDPQLLGDPIHDGYMPDSRKRLSEDLTSTLPLRLYTLVMLTMIQSGVSSEHVAGSLFRYMKRYIHGSIGEGEIDCDDDDEQVLITYKNRLWREIIEALEKLLPSTDHQSTGPNIIPFKSLSEILQCAIALQASSSCKHGLEIRMAKQLNEASVEDLLIPAQLGYAKELKYDIGCVKRIFRTFHANYFNNSTASPDHHHDISPMIKVAELIEEFLAKVASDEEELTKDTFISIAKMSVETTNRTNRTSDRIYRAIDIYLDKHPNLTESEREDVCQVLDCHKMSSEACTHAVQNERLPLRVVVQALFVGHLHLREAIINRNIEDSDYGWSQKDDDTVGSVDDDGEGVRKEMQRIDCRVIELEKECCKIKGQMEKGRARAIKGKGKGSVWKQLKRKLGCISSSSSAYEYDRHQVKKKGHTGH